MDWEYLKSQVNCLARQLVIQPYPHYLIHPSVCLSLLTEITWTKMDYWLCSPRARRPSHWAVMSNKSDGGVKIGVLNWQALVSFGLMKTQKKKRPDWNLGALDSIFSAPLSLYLSFPLHHTHIFTSHEESGCGDEQWLWSKYLVLSISPRTQRQSFDL